MQYVYGFACPVVFGILWGLTTQDILIERLRFHLDGPRYVETGDFVRIYMFLYLFSAIAAAVVMMHTTPGIYGMYARLVHTSPQAFSATAGRFFPMFVVSFAFMSGVASIADRVCRRLRERKPRVEDAPVVAVLELKRSA